MPILLALGSRQFFLVWIQDQMMAFLLRPFQFVLRCFGQWAGLEYIKLETVI